VVDNDMTAILYTSGSTGRPKRVVLSHHNTVGGAKSVAQYCENRLGDTLLAALPMSFDTGFSQPTTAFLAAAPTVLLNYLMPRDVLNALVKAQVTGLTAVPPLWLQLVQLDWQASCALACRLAESAPGPVKALNLGGGFGIPYFPGEQRLDLGPIGEQPAAIAEEAARTMPQVELIIALGRYLVGEAGRYVCRVVDKKVSRGNTFLMSDGGMHHRLSDSGNVGQVLRKNYPVAIGNRMDAPAGEAVSVLGPLCAPLDIAADLMALPEADIGDLMVVHQSGAYGATASPQGFLVHSAVAEILV
jgi:acyl-CoA synthetase (AMP-forming)/AMP-acid ligase II